MDLETKEDGEASLQSQNGKEKPRQQKDWLYCIPARYAKNQNQQAKAGASLKYNWRKNKPNKAKRKHGAG